MNNSVENPYMLWHGTNNDNPHDTVAKVAAFEAACGATLYPLGTAPPVEKLKLRLSLELEELYEKAQAMGLEGTFQEMLYKKFVDNGVYVPRDIYDGGPYTHYVTDTSVYDPVALLDACCDQRYVQDGTMLTCGLDKAFPEAFAEVQMSNLSKFPNTGEEVRDTVEKYTREGIAITITLSEGDTKFPAVVRREADGKILKNAAYHPANLAPIVAKYTPT